MKRLFWGVRLFILMAGYKYKAYFAYQGWTVVFHFLGMISGYFAGFTVIWARMRVFPSIGSFTFWEVALLYSLELLCYSFANTFMRVFWNTKELILRGGLDAYLVWPCRPLLGLSARYFEAGYAGHIVFAIVIAIIAQFQLHLDWGALNWLLFFGATVGGTGIYIGFTALPSILAFWFGDTSMLTGIFRMGFREIISYPLTIYPVVIRVILTFILPYAFITYYPSLELLGKNGDFIGFISISLGLGVLMIAFVIFAWARGLKRYESAGG